ncbi:MAG TPA: DUF6351 family protein [Gaiellaceae bacterium]|nr:DUF6351 family protein [Gaiellaceae bacterium]
MASLEGGCPAGADGYGRSTWDNVGVQYGLGALVDGKITPAEFLHPNATVGSWKDSKDMVQEGCPFLSDLPDGVCDYSKPDAGTP